MENYANNAIGQYGLGGSTVNPNLISGLNGPDGIAPMGNNLFVVNYVSGTVGEYTTSGAIVNASLISGLSGPDAIAMMGNDLFVANYKAGTIGEYTTSGATVNPALISGLSGPSGILIMGTDLFVVNYGSGTVGEYTTSGATVDPALISGLSDPDGIAVMGNDFFIPNFAAGTIGEYTTSGATVNPSLISGLSGPAGIVIMGNSLFVANDAAGTVGEYTTSGGTVNASLISGLSAPAGIAIAGAAGALAPSVDISPGSLSVAPGASATFTADASGTAPLAYQWSFNGANLPGADSSTLTLSDVLLTNAGSYLVVVSNAYGSAISPAATLAVTTFITIIQPPASIQVDEGGTATFSVQAVSSLPLTYQWFFGNAAINGATNSSYSVVDAQALDAGTYSIQIANSAGSSANAAAALLVVAPTAPTTTKISYTIKIVAGTNLIANQLNQGGDMLFEIMPSVPDGTVISKYDNASGTWSSATFSAALGSWDPPSIALRPGEGALLISPTNFSLTFSGTPNVPSLPPAIPDGQAWLVSRQTNDIGTYETIVGDAPQPGAVIYKWDPTNVTYDIYTYSASGWSGGVEPTAAVSESMWIGPDGGTPGSIPDGPVITQQPTNEIVALGGSTAFTVAATGAAPLSYQWQLNNNQIQGATNSVLNIPDVEPGDIGDYSVAIVNPIGVVNSAVTTLTISGIGTLPAAPDFANAGTLGVSINGTGTTNNVGASTEPSEPSPGGIPFGSTVWVQWQPQVSGIASLSTAGSDFDSVLGVFTGTNLSNLQLVGADEGSGPYLSAALSFDAVAATTYYIQISGFFGAQGNIVLSWNLQATNVQIPVIVGQPQSQTQTNGGPVMLSVVATNTSPDVLYQWMLNGAAVPGATNSNFIIPAIDPSQVGLYTVGITNPPSLLGVVSAPANVVIFDPGSGQPGYFANFHPQDKFLTAASLTPHDPNIPNDPAPAGGVDGTTIFSTVGSTADAGEPDHCGYPPCHSMWYPFTNGVNGLVTMTTSNKFDAVLEVYSGPLVITNFNQLIPLACSANHGTNGEAVTFDVYSGSTYWVVVDGVNCASGPITIFWNISAPPAFSVLPLGQSLKSGGSVTLTTGTVGSPPFKYQWEVNGAVMQGATNSSLVITNFQAANQGDYSVTTWNSSGTNTSAPAVLYLNNPPRFVSFGMINGTVSAEFAGAANSNYVFESSSNLSNWSPVTTNASPIGLFNFYAPYIPTNQPQFYRAVAH